MEARIGGALIRIIQGDITDQDVDAIVNAANPSLMGGGGVDGAIHRRGGPAILEECRSIRRIRYPDGLPVGEAVITTGGRLKARYVIHTVGPIWRGGGAGEAELLAKAYMSSLKLAAEKYLDSIAFPSISTGAYGYPIGEASRIALETIKEFLEKEDKLKEVRLVLYTMDAYEAFKERFREVFKTGRP
ncbi:MAG: O-acetyl-ADP-ribose deacetylase [Candidatus Bathyarchaeia archaeon]